MRIYLLSLLVLVSTFLAHYVGMQVIYYKFPLFDLFTHLLGGVGIALFGYGLSLTFGLKIRGKIIFTMLFVIAAGLTWELFEIYYDIAGHNLWTKQYNIDTSIDLVMDALGGIVAIWIGKIIDKK